MTEQEKQQLKVSYVKTALYYGQQIADVALQVYIEDLEDLPYLDVETALVEFRRDPRMKGYPLPAQIRAKLRPKMDPSQESELIASEILEAIGRVGPYRIPLLSPVARDLVRREGGWQHVCEMVTDESIPMFRAQWRRLAESLLIRGDRGESSTQLPEPPNGGNGEGRAQLIDMSQLLRSMPK
jgi:hypothetical protein